MSVPTPPIVIEWLREQELPLLPWQQALLDRKPDLDRSIPIRHITSYPAFPSETGLAPYYRVLDQELKELSRQARVPLRLLARQPRRRDRIWANFQACRRFLRRRLSR